MNMAEELTNTRGSSYSDSNQTWKNWWAERQNTWIYLTVKQKKNRKGSKKGGAGERSLWKKSGPTESQILLIVEDWEVNERKMRQEKHC